MPSIEVAEPITKLSNEEDLTKLRTKLAAEGIATFKEMLCSR